MTQFDENIFEPAQETEPVNAAPAEERRTGEFAAGSSEYHYIRPEATRRAYSDASYIPSDHATEVPRRYRCGEEKAGRKAKKEKAQRRGMPAAAVIALCLVCAIIGGIGGGALAGSFMGSSGELSAPDTQTGTPAMNDSSQTGTVINRAESSATPSIGTNIVADGSVLSAASIYSIACDQTVAITTEVTYRSFYGYSTAPVSGSGFIISSDGYILTNYHVIEDAATGGYEISVLTYDGSEYIASIVGYEEDNDVAVLKIDANGLSAATLGDSDGISVGEDVYAVGNPLGELGYTMTSGMISALDRDITTYDSSAGTYTSINMFQIDAAVNSGNSGGPVYNNRGQVIGIVTAKYSDTGVEGLGFAIPINDAVSIAEDLITKGYVSGKAYMGVSVDTLPASVSQYYGLPSGAYVVGVEAGSCAEAAGLEEGDIITALDETPITSGDDLISAKKAYRAGDSASITVSRSGEDVVLTIVFDEEIPTEEPQPQQSNQSQNPYQGYGQIPGYGYGYGFGG